MYNFDQYISRLIYSQVKGQIKSERIHEIINFPNFDAKNLKDFCPMYFRAGISQIFRVKFWKIDNFINSF